MSGTYHVAAAGETSWHGYAQRVIGFARAAGRPLKVTDDAITAVRRKEWADHGAKDEATLVALHRFAY